MRLTGGQTWNFQNDLYVQSVGTAVGPTEGAGPLGEYFDFCHQDLYCSQQNWEMAERHLMTQAIDTCLSKANMTSKEVDLLLAGDLLNQNITANYVARSRAIPFLCMFGACSTSMETLAVGSALIDGGFANSIVAATSSHNATAERQFRYPTEYGGQKPDTATFTVTGGGAILVSKEPSSVKITSATIGRVTDYGVKNPYDMGSAMAPAAADTIQQHLKDLNRTPEDYDLIVTGDLSSIGSPILRELLKEEEIDISGIHNDCGLMIYRPDQEVFAGGSGCACSAVVTYGYLLNQLKEKKYKRILVVATGALLSPVMIQQKETIPTIAHGVVFEAV
ncbi:stage V sporulation protein AD [Bacillus mesophilus]|uniref:Stage V sporulation protein AD n=1 Tax=Bacillus mesophilus TaxID=1808955 RepID=A0A6M0Q511_9BACI|nr:stage V sporulation protein AD [Bacillus mesophilus]MBM7661148.1 stage V sporulation protein AD [Bacillus mesophilus]NEY71324.1 stage V sporulation protein AD [Bacillus mesophilus]